MSQTKQNKEITVIDLFAGVGGFRTGLRRAGGKYGRYKTVWSNQWEPSTNTQHASEVYRSRFGSEGHSNVNIAEEVKNDNVPDHHMLVGGFPCQDYSVARTLSKAAGLSGKKGVLWWEIYKIIKKKAEKRKPTKYLFLENVDRLIKSPAPQRGRDFAIMLACLAEQGYAAEWRVVNAAEYGFPQRRRRVYILAYRKGTRPYRQIVNTIKKNKGDAKELLLKKGIMPRAFPVVADGHMYQDILDNNITKISEKFNIEKIGTKTPFENAGAMLNGTFYTVKTKAAYEGKYKFLKDVVLPLSKVGKEFRVDEKDLPRWKKLKGAKNETRTTKDGFEYRYSEGAMIFPDPLNKPSRTIVTGEGGTTPSRFKHVIKQSGKLRRLVPVELEKLCGFKPGHTAGQSNTKRAFFMGNALVVGVIEKIGKELLLNI